MGFFQADVDGDGSIDYIEFITATMHLNRVEREDHLYKAFEYFDKDKSGFVSLLSIYCTRNMSFVYTLTQTCTFAIFSNYFLLLMSCIYLLQVHYKG